MELGRYSVHKDLHVQIYVHYFYLVVNSALSLSIPVSEILSAALVLSIPAASLSFSSMDRAMELAMARLSLAGYANTWVLHDDIGRGWGQVCVHSLLFNAHQPWLSQERSNACFSANLIP